MMKKLLLTVCLLGWLVLPTGAQSKKILLPAQYVDQVTSLFSLHRWDKGKELLDEGLDRYPFEPNLHYLAGRYWWNAKDYDRARFHLVKSVQINYDQVDAKSLLVNVEDVTGNYSSAVCYVNELLEVNPYWKGLWLRKVDLYKKMGNYAEATALLKRLRQIYPSDSSLSGDYYEILEQSYMMAHRNGDIDAEEEALREMVRIVPTDIDYQLAYANILLREGRRDDAYSALATALDANPGNAQLIAKMSGIMMDEGQHLGALALIHREMEAHPSGELTSLHDRIQEETARIEEEADAYQLHRKIYATSQKEESLDYLLKEAYMRNYTDDALYYIDQKRRRSGDTPGLFVMEYNLYRREGDPAAAGRVLAKAEELFPDSYDISLLGCRKRLDEAASLMSEEAYASAVAPLEYVRAHAPEEEMRQTAIRRLAVCYTQTSRFDQAEECLKERAHFDQSTGVTVDYASLLVKQGKADDALDAIWSAYVTESDPAERKALCYAYEETAIGVLREQMQAGAYPSVVGLCDTMLQMDPKNYWALYYASSAAQDPRFYVEEGLKYYPDDVAFRIKKASMLTREGHPEEALALLREVMAEHPGDDTLSGALAEVSIARAAALQKQKDWAGAAAVLDTALVYRPNDEELRVARGRIYEHDRQWDSAFVYQRVYKPAPLEMRAYLERMYSIKNKVYKNTADAGYDAYRFNGEDAVMSIATGGYSHDFGKRTIGGRINYTSRDGEGKDIGGTDLQMIVQYTQDWKNWTFGGQVGVGFKYFPKLIVEGAAKYDFSGWELEGGAMYRLMRDDASMIGINAIPSVTLGNFYLSGKVALMYFKNNIFVNGLVRTRFYPFPGGKTFFEVQGGAGTAPELSFSDVYYDANLYNHLNTFVSCSLNWLITDNISFNLSGTWNTLYDQQESVRYRNMTIAHAQMVVYF